MGKALTSSGNTVLSSVAMFVLAASPMLNYYKIGNKGLSLLAIAGILLFICLFINEKIRFNVLPKSYLLYWGWCAIQMYFIAGIAGWSDYLPGGILFCIFSVLLIIMIQLFDYKKLFKYMKLIFIVASILMIVQYAVYLITDTRIVFFPILTNNIGGFTPQEMLERHMGVYHQSDSGRFCSIFMEPSYFGQYGLVLLTMELFRNEVKDKLFSRFSIFIVLVLLILRSGTGLLGLLIVAITKVLYVIVKTRKSKYYVLLLFLIPLTVFSIQSYMETASGSYVSSRLSEISVDNAEESTSSGAQRLYSGWFFWGDLSPKAKILGASRGVAGEFREEGFTNMANNIAITQGIIGLLLIIYFYLKECRKQDFIMYALFITLVTISLIEACYLGGLMLIITTIIVGAKYKGELSL